MPTYDYLCRSCKKVSEIFHSMKDDARTICPYCNEPTLERQIGMGAGLVFKGSGFYETDYKKNSNKNQNSNKKTKTSTQSSETKKSES